MQWRPTQLNEPGTGEVRLRQTAIGVNFIDTYHRSGLYPLTLPSSLGMEACGSAHHWARKLQTFGHTVRLMAPQFVKPYVKSNKNDAADAEAICEAVTRPNMRFVPIKNVEQQSVLSLHRIRQGFVKARTAQANQIRGLLAEYGLIVTNPDGHFKFPHLWPLKFPQDRMC
jgi:transposase